MSTVITRETQVDLTLVLKSIDELPSIPETLIEILRLLDDPDSGAADLAEVVRLDAPLAAKILRLANSPYYGSRGDVADVGRCIAVLGYRTMRNVAICVSVATNLVSAVAGSAGRMDYRELWRHSVAAGACAKQLGRMMDDPDPEELFTAGLLHDMGKFVLELYDPTTYDEVVRKRAGSGRSLVEEEREAFGFDHAQVGAAFAQSWRFPAFLTTCFSDHHRRVGARDGDRAARAVAIVALADYLANTMEPARSDLGFDPRVVDAPRLHAACGLSAEDVEQNLDAIREAIDLSTVFLSVT